MAPSHRSSPPSRRPKSSTSRRHSRRRAWARRGRPGRCRVAGLPPSRGAPSLGGRGDHLGSPRGRVGRPIRLLAGGRHRLRDFGRPRRLQPGRAVPAGSSGRKVIGPTPEASRGRLFRGSRAREVRISHACGRGPAVWPSAGLLSARPGTPGIYFEYSHRSMSLVQLACCFPGALGAVHYFVVRVGGRGRPLGAEWPHLFEK